MVLQDDADRVKHLLAEAISVLCKNGLTFDSELCVEGLLGITLDNSDIFLVNISETITNEGRKQQQTSATKSRISLATEKSPAASSTPGRHGKKRGRGSEPASPEPTPKRATRNGRSTAEQVDIKAEKVSLNDDVSSYAGDDDMQDEAQACSSSGLSHSLEKAQAGALFPKTMRAPHPNNIDRNNTTDSIGTISIVPLPAVDNDRHPNAGGLDICCALCGMKFAQEEEWATHMDQFHDTSALDEQVNATNIVNIEPIDMSTGCAELSVSSADDVSIAPSLETAPVCVFQQKLKNQSEHAPFVGSALRSKSVTHQVNTVVNQEVASTHVCVVQDQMNNAIEVEGAPSFAEDNSVQDLLKRVIEEISSQQTNSYVFAKVVLNEPEETMERLFRCNGVGYEYFVQMIRTFLTCIPVEERLKRYRSVRRTLPETKAVNISQEEILNVILMAKAEMNQLNLTQTVFAKVVLGRTPGIVSQMMKFNGVGYEKHIHTIRNFFKRPIAERCMLYQKGVTVSDNSALRLPAQSELHRAPVATGLAQELTISNNATAVNQVANYAVYPLDDDKLVFKDLNLQ